MEKVRYETMLPHEIVARRRRFPAAFIGLGGLEWHGEHLAVGNDALKAEKLCELAAARSGGFAFPTLWYGEPRVTGLMEVNHDPDGGISQVAVIERHHGTGNVSNGFAKGFDFAEGAIASTVAHDSHNLVIAGKDRAAMARAAEELRRVGGGLAAVSGDGVSVLPLALAGLMSVEPLETVLSQHEELSHQVEAMGCSADPFATLSFIALPVIPKLKITDKGLVDVEKFDFVSLFAT